MRNVPSSGTSLLSHLGACQPHLLLDLVEQVVERQPEEESGEAAAVGVEVGEPVGVNLAEMPMRDESTAQRVLVTESSSLKVVGSQPKRFNVNVKRVENLWPMK